MFNGTPGTITRAGARITIVGNVDVARRNELKQHLFDAIDDRHCPIADVGRAGYLDSSVHGVLIMCAKEVHALKLGTLTLANANEDLREFLQTSGLIRHFQLIDDQ